MEYNPTQALDISFQNYVARRKAQSAAHLDKGIPDYAFAYDLALRQKIKATPGVFPFFKAVTSTYIPMIKQSINMNSLKVGPNQYGHIYDMTVDCAKRLGIGIPSVYIVSSVGTMNAYTYALDDEAPIVVLHSSLVERMTEGELKAVIGHECGHIHNNHGIYNIAAEMILNQGMGNIPVVSQMLTLLSFPIQLLFLSWSRAAEVTCDRAGMICCNDPHDAFYVNAKLMSGAMLGADAVNLEAATKQFETLQKTPVKLLELSNSHPVSMRRILAEMEFQNSELLYQWRPEWKNPGMELLSKEELDLRCKKYITIIGKKGVSNG